MRYTARGENAKTLCYAKAIVGWIIAIIALIGSTISGDAIVGLVIFLLVGGWGTMKFVKARRIDKVLKFQYSGAAMVESMHQKMMEVQERKRRELKSEPIPSSGFPHTPNSLKNYNFKPGDYVQFQLEAFKNETIKSCIRLTSEGDRVELHRQYKNPHNPHAIIVVWNYYELGYVTKVYSQIINTVVLEKANTYMINGYIAKKVKTQNGFELEIGVHLPRPETLTPMTDKDLPLLTIYRDN